MHFKRQVSIRAIHNPERIILTSSKIKTHTIDNIMFNISGLGIEEIKWN
jgi:hypothetical protein